MCDKIALQLKFFDAMVSFVVCFAAGHRRLYAGELQKLDAQLTLHIANVGKRPHTHTHTDDIYLGRVGIGGVVILHEKGLLKIIWSTSCLIELVIEII